MNVDKCYRLINYVCNKNQQGDIKPNDFNLIINQAATSFLNYLLGSFQQYVPGRPQPRVSYSQNEVARGRLTPLIYGYILSVDGNGISPYPGDYLQVDAMTKIDGSDRIRYVTQDGFYSVYNSRIDPYQTNPFYLIEDKQLHFYPSNIASAKLSYVRQFPPIVWAYDLDVNGRPVYNAGNSQDPPFYDIDMWEVIARALMMVGVNLSSQLIQQYAVEIEKSGQ